MTSTDTPEAKAAEAHVDDAAHDHPSDGKYVQIALILAFFTALEVGTYFVDLDWAAVPVLIFLMIVKFAMVALFFMHLRFDSRLFRRLFVTGLVTAIAVYIAALTMFEFWSEDDNIDDRTGGGGGVGMITPFQP